MGLNYICKKVKFDKIKYVNLSKISKSFEFFNSWIENLIVNKKKLMKNQFIKKMADENETFKTYIIQKR